MDGGYPQGAGPPAPPALVGYYQPAGAYAMPAPAPAPQQTAPNAQAGNAANARNGNTVSIWAGDLDSYMDENFLRNAVAACGWSSDITRIKVVRDRFTGAHAGYGFLDAASPDAASRVLSMGSGMPIPGSTRCWRLNMGRSGSGAPGADAETNVYVGDLDPSVTEFQLMSAFRPRYASTRHAKVVSNEIGVSRGFGFLRFSDSADAERAVAEMQGYEFNGKPIRLSPANGRSRTQRGGGGGGGGGAAGHDPAATNKRPRQTMSPDDPNNTTLFIGGTSSHISEDLLWREFTHFGDLDAVRVPPNKTGFAFVRFKTREAAQRAKDELSRTHVVSLNPHKPVRLEWATEQISAPRSQSQSLHSHHPHHSHTTHVAALAGLGAPAPPYEHHLHPYGGDYAPAPTANYRNDPVRVPIGNGVQGLVIAGSVHAPPIGAAPALVAASMSSVSSGSSAILGANGAQKAGKMDTGNKKGCPALPGGPSTGGAVGESEPPSKRAAVGRSEYAAAGLDKNDKGGSELKNAVDAAPFSWLSSAPQQAPSKSQ